MKKKTIVICILLVIIVMGWIFRNSLIRSYVSICHHQLETYAIQMLDNNERKSDKYGIWKTKCYPDDGVVEFWTGGWGLAPSSTYEGFYYAADNMHKPFSVVPKDMVSMEISGDLAYWTDGTDNHGTSTRILDSWFWFEASF